MKPNSRRRLPALLGGFIIFLASSAHAARGVYPADCLNINPLSAVAVPPPWPTMCIPRTAHTATLLPDGNILVCGGLGVVDGNVAAPTNHCELSLEQQGVWVPVGDMGVARASHTATLLANGKVLVTGGVTAANGAGVPTAFANTSELFNPLIPAAVWATGATMNSARYDHTATLLQTGKILVCGGQSALAPTINGACDIFNADGTTLDGSSPIPMVTGRTRHTATALPDGRVYFAGGFNQNVTPPYMANNEIYNPGTNSMGPAHSLEVGRSDHRAVLMGDGRVLIVGGYSGQKDDRNTGGILDFSEIYDPTQNSMSPASHPGTDVSHPIRVQSPALALYPDGSVEMDGGLGNITTTYLTSVGGLLDPGSSIEAAQAGKTPTAPSPGQIGLDQSSMTFYDSQNLNLPLDFFLGTPVSGIIQQGEIYFSTPSISFPGGVVYFSTGDTNVTDLPGGDPHGRGLYADLAGTPVTCIQGQGCGHVARTVRLKSAGGVVTFSEADYPAITTPPPSVGGGGRINWAGLAGPLNATSGAGTIDKATSQLPLFPLILTGLPANFKTHNVVAGSLEIVNATISNATGTITINASNPPVKISLPAGPYAVGTDLNNLGQVQIPIQFAGFEGTVTSLYDKGTTSCGYDGNGNNALNQLMPITVPCGFAATARFFDITNAGPALFSGTIRARLIFDGADVGGQALTVDISTVVIRTMAFGDTEKYNPQTDSWSFDDQGFAPHINHATVVVPNSNIRLIGGKSCELLTGTCASLLPVGDASALAGHSGGNSFGTNTSIITKWGPWTLSAAQLITARDNHTATPLPNGKILIAGGGNGITQLRTSELFDPIQLTFAQTTGQLRDARDLHSATLLPNGKVLVAGGFSVSAATNSAELYYPDSQSWSPTAPMTQSRDQHTATLLPDGNVFVFGGFNSSGYVNTGEIYYSTAGIWKTVGTPVAGVSPGCTGGRNYAVPADFSRARHTATLLQDGRVMIFGGINQNGISSNLIFYDEVNGWSCGPNRIDIGAVSRPVYLHTATLLPNGLVLTAGGDAGQGAIGKSFVYDPRTNPVGAAGWTQTPNMSAPRFNHTATLLPDGLVLVTGGAQAFNQVIDNVEIYDVGGSTWTGVGSLSGNRAYHTTSVTSNGTVFNIGGHSGSSLLNTVDSIYFTQTPDALTKGFVSPGARKASITSVSQTIFNAGSTVTLRGSGFGGYTEANGGGASNGSNYFQPRVYLQALDSSGGSSSQGSGGFLVDLTTRVYNGASINGVAVDQRNTWPSIIGSLVVPSSITIKIPSCDIAHGDTACENKLAPYGWYNFRVVNNGIFSDGSFVHIGPDLPRTQVTISASTAPVGQILNPIYGSSNTIVFTWPNIAAVDNVNGYNVYSSSTGVWISTVGTGNVPNECPNGTCQFSHTGLAPDTTESIMVAPFNISGDGPLATSATTYTLSTAPISVRITTVGVTTLDVTWNTNNNAAGTYYEVSYSSDDPHILPSNGQLPFTTSFSTPFTVVPFNSALTTNVAHIDQLFANTTYYVRVRAFNQNLIASDFSSMSSATTVSQITGLVPASGDNCFPPAATTCIKWTWAKIDAAISYKVYNATGGAVIVIKQPLGGGNTVTYFDTPLSTNTGRVRMVSAVTAAGEGPLSASVTYYTDAAVPFINPPAPFTNVSTNSFTAQWDSNQNPFNTTNFIVSYAATPVGVPATGPATSLVLPNTKVLMTAITSGLNVAEIYFASVAAVNQDGRIQKSNGVDQWRALGAISTLPEAVQNAKITAVTPTSISISWDRGNNTSTATYIVTLSTDDLTTNGKQPFTTNVSTWIAFSARFNGVSTTITSLLTGKLYNINITASNAFGQTQLTPAVLLTTTTTNGGAAPGSLGGMIGGNSDVTIEGTLGDGRYVAISVPSGAFPVPVFFSISTRTVVGAVCPGNVDFAVDILTNPSLQPVKPVVVLMKYRVPPEVGADELAGVDPTKATLFRLDEAQGKCVPMVTSVDTTNHQIIARINHFTPFILGQLDPSGTPDSTRVFPNPFFVNTDGFMTFENMPPYARVRIFTMRGDVVYDRLANGAGLLIWPGINKAGRNVASGVYFAAIESTGATMPRKVIKIAVLK